ncbi:multidrug resistance-associated protein 1-like isoform X2 [Biomphalaria glabrata]|nr:multidrug resistance-associated protein 1-like isoform X2 [Biomphalaria glabrata]
MLLLYLPIYWLGYLLKQQKGSLHIDTLFVFKMIFVSILIVTEIITLTMGCIQYLVGSAVLASSVKLLSFAAVGCTVLQECKRSIMNSSGLLLFCCFMVLTHIVPFYSKIILKEYSDHLTVFAAFYINFAALLVLTVLHCFNHKASKFKNSKEKSVGLISKLTLGWVTRLVLRGYKKPLTEKEIEPLNNSLSSATVVPDFLYFLNKYGQMFHKNYDHNKSQTKEYSRVINGNCPSKNHQMSNDYPLQEVKKDDESNEFDQLMIDFLPKTTEDSNRIRLPLYLWKAILRTFWKKALYVCCLGQIAKFFTLLCPFIMKLLIDFAGQNDEPIWHGYFLATMLFVTSVLSQIFFEYYLYNVNKTSVRVKAAVVSALYRKSLSLSSESHQSTSTGELIQLLTKDIDTIWNMVEEGFSLPESPTEFFVGIIMVYYTVGVAMFAGLGAIAVLFCFKLMGSRKQIKFEDELREAADERIKIASQTFTGIKVLKLYAWEEAFKSIMNTIRNKELFAVFKFNLFRFFTTFAWTGAVFWMTFCTFLAYVLIDDAHHLTASTAFVTISYLAIVRRATNCWSYAIDYVIAGMVSSRRIAKFLVLPEMKVASSAQSSGNSEMLKDTAILLQDATLGWTSSGKAILKNISLDVPKNSLVAVVGMVGCGKSSLISAILGEMDLRSGEVQKQGTISYSPQEAWILNDTVRNNVLFDSELDEEKYQKVIQACALESDLAVFPAGDRTEIGEKGINLSGGQKQRVSLARAVYQESDVYLLDDPLSAVDAHVGRHIFDHVIGKNGLLHNKTRVLVTHGVHWLPWVDKVVVLTDGQVSEVGPLDQLMAHNGPFAQFLSQYLEQQEKTLQIEEIKDSGDHRHSKAVLSDLEIENNRKDIFERLLSIESQKSDYTEEQDVAKDHTFHASKEKISKQVSIKSDKDYQVDAQKIIEEEELAGGRVSWTVYTTFGHLMGYISILVLTVLFLTVFVSELVAGFWLTYWVDSPLLNNASIPADSVERANENYFYLKVYSVWGILETVTVVIVTVVKAFRHRRVARIIHDNLITSLLACPIQFFDATPIGRVLSRLSKDIGVIDLTLLLWMEIWLHAMFCIFCSIITVIINLPVLLAVIIPVLILFYIFEKIYLPTSCQIRRLERKWLSPVLSHASESYAGTSVIRALGKEVKFMGKAEEKIDFLHSMTITGCACERWLSMRLGFLSDILVFFAGLMAVTYKDDLSPGLIGLTLSIALTVTGNMQLQVRVASLLETDIISMERILQYTHLPSEAARHVSHPGCSVDWPNTGDISFNNISLRYRPGLEMVLKNVCFHIRGQEKIGVVGRTGAGKSSLMLALFRLVEPCQGQIIIDGIDISKLGLYDLRQKLTILPQDPLLFTGTLRLNLDPFEQYSDEEIWKSLELCYLKTYVDKLPEGLNHQVGENGINLSIGQRQLVCLGRALLRKTKILVLDEATAAVDVETDELIQKTIRSQFKDCTVLTIAHRINTIMDYDRILVMDKGQVLEFDSPSSLLKDVNSLFYKLSSESHTLPQYKA